MPYPESSVKVGAVIDQTRAEGPGLRFAVWVQGCSIQCIGCFNPHFWGSRGGNDVPISELASRALDAGVQGVTLLGGEPFEQAEALSKFASSVAAEGLSVMTFSGYERSFLESFRSPVGSAELLASTDLLVTGPYDANATDKVRPWVGSTNQEFHFLTERYQALENDIAAAATDSIEIRVTPHGEITLNGWATTDQLDELLSDPHQRLLQRRRR